MVPIVEIVGPAGAGKTTLCQALCLKNKSIYQSNFPDVRKISQAPFFIRNGLQILPDLLRLYKPNSRQVNRREFAWLSVLRGWSDNLPKELQDHNMILLDQGPVFLLTMIYLFGPQYLREKKAESFWQDLYSRWADRLQTIVWLDASDDDLLKRIRSRDKDHVIKNESTDNTLEFLANYRKAYERTISCLSDQNRNMRVLCFNTGQKSVDDIVKELLHNF